MEKKKILIVDDDDLICDLYGDFFKQNGYAIETATTVDQALIKIREGLPDIVISDIVLPKKDGFALYDEVHSYHPDLPFIFMTGYEHDNTIATKLEKYQVKWFSKPTKLEEALEIVRSMIGS